VQALKSGRVNTQLEAEVLNLFEKLKILKKKNLLDKEKAADIFLRKIIFFRACCFSLQTPLSLHDCIEIEHKQV
jgi:hypothetical protein